MRVLAAAAARVAVGRLRILGPLAAALVVGACATVAPTGPPLQGRTIEGRLSVRYTDLATAKEEALSGRFVWTTGSDGTALSLLDPFGQTVALIRTTTGRASIAFRDGRRVDGASPDDLTRETLGWSVPVHGLGAWLDGHADAASAATPLDDGRIRQDGWTIRFVPDDAAPAGTGPKRIDLVYPGPPVAIEMRLVVDRRGAE